MHGQRNALDSAYALDVDLDYSIPGNAPERWLAEGRDASATIDAANSGFGKNDGDNEITGLHVSDGDPSVRGVLGAKAPKLWRDGCAGSTPSNTATTRPTRSSRRRRTCRAARAARPVRRRAGLSALRAA